MLLRQLSLAYFRNYQRLDLTLEPGLSLFWGGLNTAVLIGSSLTMALAVRCAQTNSRKWTVNWLILTMLLGGVFLGVKVVEYADKFEHHLIPGASFLFDKPEFQDTAQIYFSLYFALTGEPFPRGSDFHTVTPCRAYDSRAVSALFSGAGRLVSKANLSALCNPHR